MNAGNRAQVDQRLRIDGPVQAHACNRERSGNRRMRVADRHDVLSFIIYAQVHLRLAGRPFVPLADDGSVQPHLDHFVLGHEAFGDAGGRGPDRILVHLAGDIPVVGRHKILHIHAPSDLHNQFFGLGICRKPLQFAHLHPSFISCKKDSIPLWSIVIHLHCKQNELNCQ